MLLLILFMGMYKVLHFVIRRLTGSVFGCSHADEGQVGSSLLSAIVNATLQSTSAEVRSVHNANGLNISSEVQHRPTTTTGTVLKVEESIAATITPAPGLNECARSWLSFLLESQSWSSATYESWSNKSFSYLAAGLLRSDCVTHVYLSTGTNFITKSSMSGYTLCPGESSRYKLIATSVEEKIFFFQRSQQRQLIAHSTIRNLLWTILDQHLLQKDLRVQLRTRTAQHNSKHLGHIHLITIYRKWMVVLPYIDRIQTSVPDMPLSILAPIGLLGGMPQSQQNT